MCLAQRRAFFHFSFKVTELLEGKQMYARTITVFPTNRWRQITHVFSTYCMQVMQISLLMPVGMVEESHSSFKLHPLLQNNPLAFFSVFNIQRPFASLSPLKHILCDRSCHVVAAAAAAK